MAEASQDPKAPAIEASGLCKRFPRTWALRNVDLRLERGELLTLLGPNGSGKSTLLRILSTASRPTFGEVRVFGSSRRSRGRDVLRLIGVLSHHSYVYHELTALENLEFAATMYGLSNAGSAPRTALANVGLAHVADERVRTFSSGMRKRLALARATIHDPEIVLLDEPYGALDADGIKWVDRFMVGLRESNKTAILATHEISRALAICDRVLELRAGQVVYDGPSETYALSLEGTEAGGLGTTRP